MDSPAEEPHNTEHHITVQHTRDSVHIGAGSQGTSVLLCWSFLAVVLGDDLLGVGSLGNRFVCLKYGPQLPQLPTPARRETFHTSPCHQEPCQIKTCIGDLSLRLPCSMRNVMPPTALRVVWLVRVP